MKAPVSWLKDYVDVELSPAELADNEGVVTVRIRRQE